MVDMDTPPRVLAAKSSHRELERKVQRRSSRNETMCRCLRASEQKRAATHEEVVHNTSYSIFILSISLLFARA